MNRTAQGQLGFDFARLEEETLLAHLPSAMDEAVPVYRSLLEQHHRAMMQGDQKATMAIRKEAERLAIKLHGGESCGWKGGPEAPGNVLPRETAAPDGTVPLWGQTGSFVITVGQTPVRIEMDGMYGIGSGFTLWPNFGAYAVDESKPFFSETGFRSFMGTHAEMVPGMTPDTFAQKAIEAFIKGEGKGKLHQIESQYRSRAERGR